MLEGGTHDSDPRTIDFLEVVRCRLFVWQLGASRIPCDVLTRTSVVASVWWTVPVVSCYSMGDGHPRRTCPPALPRPPGTSPLPDGRRMSVLQAGVMRGCHEARVISADLNQSLQFLVLLGPDDHPEVLLQFWVRLTSDELSQLRWTLWVSHPTQLGECVCILMVATRSAVDRERNVDTLEAGSNRSLSSLTSTS